MKGTWCSAQDGREGTLEPGDFACFDSTRPSSAIQHGEFEQFVVYVPRDLWIRRIGGATLPKKKPCQFDKEEVKHDKEKISPVSIGSS